MRIRIKKLKRNIFHLEFDTQYELAATFLRFQEHYESPKFRGKVFSLEEFMDWYVTQKGKFSYYEDWHGFNIPSHVLDMFLQGDFDPLSKKEQQFLSTFRGIKGKFYIIGTFKSDHPDTLLHEHCHALYYTDDEYRAAVMRVLKGKDLSSLHAYLKKKGYHRRVWADEAHAYLIADFVWLKRKGVAVAHLAEEQKALTALFKRRWE